jgi:hypothetical protein
VVEYREAVILVAEARPEVAGDGQGTTVEARATSSPWASQERVRETGRGVLIRFDH